MAMLVSFINLTKIKINFFFQVLFGIITAEIISCFKRSLARMLVIIVSLGFGIVKFVLEFKKKNLSLILIKT